MGGWAFAQSLVTTVTLDRLQQRGYKSMLDYYLKVTPQLNEPPPERTGRAVYVTRMYSGGVSRTKDSSRLDFDALQMMREGPSKPVFRCRLQTSLCSFA